MKMEKIALVTGANKGIGFEVARQLAGRGFCVFVGARNETLRFTTVGRDALAPGAEIAGPAILLEQTAVTYLDAGFVARVHESGTLLLERSG